MIDHIVIKPNPTLIVGESFVVGDTDVFHMKGSGFVIDLFNDVPVWADCKREDLESVITFLSKNYSIIKTIDSLNYREVNRFKDELIVNANFKAQLKLSQLGFEPVKYEFTCVEAMYIESVFYENETENFKIEYLLYDDSDRYAKFELRFKLKGFPL